MLERAFVVIALCLAACGGTPKTAGERQSLEQSANATLQAMIQKDPGLRQVIANAAGYVVFPEVGKGGVIVGGAYGVGMLYERGRPVGSVKLQQASIGAQLGGQTFAELLVLHNPMDVAKIKAGDYELGADVSVVALTAGAAAQATASSGVTAFIMPRGGAMVDVSVNGQRLTFEPIPMG
ncbi:MAG: hypothetical protein JWP01_1994 [Myxococcales bacterium]|nr:hypothetical protein [Myxococcales bacterium]